MNAHIIVDGVVQGVGYRFFVIEQARHYRIKGYVKNVPNGTVEVVAEGDKGVLNDFIKQLQIGPASAHVTDINVKWHDEEHGFTNFDVRF
jgi:acylphosphatase